MKKLIIINGTMGIGKTETSRQLQHLLPNCVFLDGDWCWDSLPFVVTEETKSMVLRNIGFLLNNFLSCSAYDNIVFCWVMHEQSIIDNVLALLSSNQYELYIFSLLCSESALKSRLLKDVISGIRTEDIIDRSLARLDNYTHMNTQKVDVSDITAQQAGQIIIQMLANQ